ncbi:AMP-binding protein [Nocardioides sp. YIM 152588]|uniref:class I adenylate-forming enzyme family protein n=1 Tax=Nocardioides sp. YIM 152588 TaxID=3158259 RepID=UPI0032E3B9ED
MSASDSPEPARDVAALVAAAAADLPERLAVIESGGRGLTWAQLDDEVSGVAAGLGDLGIVAGHRVMLALGNRLEFVAGYLGVLRAQAVAVPVNPGSTAVELAGLLADSGARVVLADEESIEAVRGAVAALPGEARTPRVVVVDEAPRPDEVPYADLVTAEARPVPPLPDPEKLAVLLYTSGASGAPRGAMLSHRALLANAEQVAAVEPPLVGSDDVVLGLLPLFHVYGLNAVLGGVLRHRAKLVLTERFDPEGTLDLIEDEACSVVPVAPPVLAHWLGVEGLAERLGPVRLVLSGSAPLSAEMVEAFEAGARVPVHQGYGLTEAAPVVTTTLHSDAAKAGSVGTALAGIEIRLVDEYGRPRAAADHDDPGEIQIRGENLFSGYWPDGAEAPGDEGWWSTGDVGFLDAEGDLYLVDRVKDLVIVSGFNVYPIEVESVIADVEGVRAAAVVGVPDAGTGEAVVAYVVPDAGIDDPAAADLLEAIRARCEERLAGFKRPARVELVEALPRTVTGKIRKGVLRGIARRRAGGLVG